MNVMLKLLLKRCKYTEKIKAIVPVGICDNDHFSTFKYC